MNTSKLTRRRFLQIAGLSAAGLTALMADAGITQTHQIVVERADIWLPRLPNELDGLSIVHLSDFHYGSSYDAEVLQSAVQITNKLRPDLVVLVGDFVTFSSFRSGISAAQCARPCAQILGDLRAPLGIFAVLGNHDQCNPQFIARSLDTQGIAVLRNSSVYVERAGARLWIAGVDDVLVGDARVDQSLKAIPQGESTVLLAHEPDFADVVSQYSVDLQLSGHSHGGQVRLPLVGAPYLPPLARKYPSGLSHLGSLSLYTTRGLGTTFLPVRFNCPPEVTLLTLRSGAS